MTLDDVYRKVGRGGAGNFLQASKSAEDKQDSKTDDVEAQSPDTPVAAPPETLSGPARAGRGGAGNFVDDSSAAHAREQSVAEETAAAVRLNPPRSGGLGGRGGAGNWKTEAPGVAAKRSAEERGKGEELERKVREVVDQGLKMPEKVHCAFEKHKA